MRMKKVVSLLLAGMMTAVAFTGCASKQQTPDPAQSSTQSSAQPAPTAAKGPLPIVNQPLKLTAFTELPTKVIDSVKTFDEIESFKELEKRTGIDIDWSHPPTGQAAEQFNLMLAAQELPDLIYWNWRGIPGGPEKAVQDGYIVKLNDLAAKHAPNLTKLLEEDTAIKKQTVTDNGTLYMAPMLRGALMKGGNPENNFFMGPQFRKDWLDKLNLQVPATISEWETVLKAFKEKDPNGNGQADELPFVAAKAPGVKHLASSWGILIDFYMDNGTVKYGPIEPAFKDYITTMKKWYDMGLLDRDFAATDDKSFRAKVTDNLGGSYVGSLGGNFGTFTTMMKDKNPGFKLVGAPWPKGPSGKSYTAQGAVDHAVTGMGTAISSKNKHPVESMKWLDYQYTPEGIELMNFGIEGVSYTKEGNKIKYVDSIAKNPDTTLGKYAIAGINGWSTIQDFRCDEINRIVPGQTDLPKIYGKASKDLIMPPITPTKEESDRFASIMSEVNTYMDEMFTKLIMGIEPIENIDKIVANIKKMNVEEALKIQQGALQRYNNRK